MVAALNLLQRTANESSTGLPRRLRPRFLADMGTDPNCYAVARCTGIGHSN